MNHTLLRGQAKFSILIDFQTIEAGRFAGASHHKQRRHPGIDKGLLRRDSNAVGVGPRTEIEDSLLQHPAGRRVVDAKPEPGGGG